MSLHKNRHMYLLGTYLVVLKVLSSIYGILPHYQQYARIWNWVVL